MSDSCEQPAAINKMQRLIEHVQGRYNDKVLSELKAEVDSSFQSGTKAFHHFNLNKLKSVQQHGLCSTQMLKANGIFDESYCPTEISHSTTQMLKAKGLAAELETLSFFQTLIWFTKVDYVNPAHMPKFMWEARDGTYQLGLGVGRVAIPQSSNVTFQLGADWLALPGPIKPHQWISLEKYHLQQRKWVTIT